ncbi:MAG: amino acid ABC transporter permease [Clostridiales bacterium]|nr:amino acid ABC transporter permease [Clostridiales bacterium]
MSGSLFSWDRFFSSVPQILPYLAVTFKIVTAATIAGVLLGILVALVRIYKTPVLYQICTVYISFMRGTPMLVQMFLILYGLPFFLGPIFGSNIGRTWDKIYFAYITFILNQGAFLSSIFYSAIKSVPIGQTESGLSVGLTGFQNFTRIVLPQAVKTALPPFGTDFVGLFQNVSLVSTIGVIDIMGRATSIGSATNHALEAYLFVALIYIIISLFMRYVFAKTDVKLSFGKKVGQ